MHLIQPKHPGCMPKEFRDAFIISFFMIMGPSKAWEERMYCACNGE